MLEVLMGRNGAALSSGRGQLLLIALAMFQLSTAQPVIFHYGQNLSTPIYGYPPLEVPYQPNAYIVELQDDDITCIGDFATSGGPSLLLSVPERSTSQQEPDLKGRCLYRNPIQLMQKSFSTRFSVFVKSSAQTLSCAGGYLSGTLQGLAFIIASDNSTQGDAGGYLGWLNSTTNTQQGHNFAVELDFWQDVQFQDPVGVHVGIDQNSLTSVGTSILESPDWPPGTGILDLEVDMWIDYDSSAKVIRIYVVDSGMKPKTPTLSKAIDLSKLLSQESMFVGFSGSISNVTFTGTGLDRLPYGLGYTIYDWAFNSDGVAPDYKRYADGSVEDFFSETEHEAKIRIDRIITLSVTIPAGVLFLILALIIFQTVH